MKIILERQIQLAFIFALLLLLTLGFFAYRSSNAMYEALKWEKHTQESLFKLNDTIILMTDAETGGRGFVITGNESYLEPFNAANQQISQNLSSLRGLLVDNSNQLDEIKKLENLISQKLDFIKATSEIRRNQGLEEASKRTTSGTGKALMDEIRLSIGKMKVEETNLLKKREADLTDSIGNTIFLLSFGTIVGIISLGLANFAVYRSVGKLRQAEDKVHVANQDLETRVEERTHELSEKNQELEEQIKQREQAEYRRRVALEAGKLGTWTLDLKTNKAEIDERSMSLFGLATEEFDGSREKAFSRIHQEDFPTVEEMFQKSLAERKNFDAEFRVSMADGTIRWNNCTGQPLFDENGELFQIIGNCRDVTESKLSEMALRHGKEQTDFYLDVAELGVWNLNLIDHTANRSLRHDQIFGYQELLPEWTYQMFLSHVLPEDKEMVAETFRVGLENGTDLDIETRIRRADGEIRWIWVRGQVLGEGGKLAQMLGTVADITTRKEAEKEREELHNREKIARKEAEIANRMRDEFLATVSHELRAPLNSILGWGRILEKGNVDAKTTEKAISTIVRNAESQNHLIEDLLDVSRIISGKLRLEVITVKPINIVESALETVRPAAQAKDITLEIKEASDVSHISGDPNRLQQVIWNLLSNAIKFTPNGGKVSVEIKRTNGDAEISVKDTGVGISQEFLPHVFERFRQADASSIRKFGGLGLGLAIVRHLIEMHGGTVRAESAGENKGSSFIIRLPVITAPTKEENDIRETLNQKNQTSIENLKLDGLLILIVDDDNDTRQLLTQSLAFHGASVISADSAENALTQLEEKNPDVLVSDIGMPNEDGYSLIRRVRVLPNEQHRNIPAIALTGFARAQDRMRALSAGFQNHVSKPVEPDELATVIASLTGRLQIKNVK